MQTVCFKDHGGTLQNPVTQASAVPVVPWWGVAGSQPVVYHEQFGQLKSLSIDHPNGGQLSGAPGQVHQGTNQGPSVAIRVDEKYDQNKESVKGQKPLQLSTTISLHPERQAHSEMGLGQTMVCTNYPYMDQCYGLFSTYGAQATGRMLLPLNFTDDGPIYVNAKQYHGILRRRQSRAKAELENKAIKARKPYMHESRHLHALRRARGCGGRFLNTKSTNSRKEGSDSDKASDGRVTQADGSPSSEVLQSDSGNVNSAKEPCGSSSLSGSEVTSMYSQGDLGRFQIKNPHSSAFHAHSNMIDNGPNINMATKWVAADGRCDFLKV